MLENMEIQFVTMYFALISKAVITAIYCTIFYDYRTVTYIILVATEHYIINTVFIFIPFIRKHSNLSARNEYNVKALVSISIVELCLLDIKQVTINPADTNHIDLDHLFCTRHSVNAFIRINNFTSFTFCLLIPLLAEFGWVIRTLDGHDYLTLDIVC